MTNSPKFEVWLKIEKQGERALYTLSTRDAEAVNAMMVAGDMQTALYSVRSALVKLQHGEHASITEQLRIIDATLVKSKA